MQAEAAGGFVEFAAFYRATFADTERCVRVVAGSVAQDVAQDAYLIAFRRWEELAVMAAPDAWVRVVARRLAVGWRRREEARDVKQRAAIRLQRQWQRPDPAAADPSSFDLDAALARLPERQRDALVLHHMVDLPVADVADLLECSLSVAKVWLHRGRERAAATLSGVHGRWTSETRWRTDGVVAMLRCNGDGQHAEAVMSAVPARGRWVFALSSGRYLLSSEDGEWMDGGRVAMSGDVLTLRPTGVEGVVVLRVGVDGDRAVFRQLRNTTPPTRDVSDEVYVRLILESTGYEWAGPVFQ